jgi:hypothetical protein
MVGQKDKLLGVFQIDKTDAAQMLWILLPRVESVKGYGLIEAQACRLIDGARINPVIVHIDFGAGDEEGASLDKASDALIKELVDKNGEKWP